MDRKGIDNPYSFDSQNIHKLCIALWRDYSKGNITREEFEERVGKLKEQPQDKKVRDALEIFGGKVLDNEV